jgi:hypothetical protein
VVQVHRSEGVANRTGPEPCVAVREGGREASVGERAGQPLSRVSIEVPGADTVGNVESNTTRCVIASASVARRGRRTWHAQTLSAREPGDLRLDRLRYGAVRVGKVKNRSRR